MSIFETPLLCKHQKHLICFNLAFNTFVLDILTKELRCEFLNKLALVLSKHGLCENANLGT